MNAISCDNKTKFSDIEALEGISKIMNTKIPQSISALFDAPILHNTVIDKEDLKDEIFRFLG